MSYSRYILSIAFLAGFLCVTLAGKGVLAVSPSGISASVQQGDGDDVSGGFDPAGKTAEEILRHFGPPSTGACLSFVDAKAVEFRKEQWSRAVEMLWRYRPKELVGWIIGATNPPEIAVEESRRQSVCLIDRMVHDAGERENHLVLDWKNNDEVMRKSQMHALRRAYQEKDWMQRRVRYHLIRSYYRDADAQAYIWRRKYVFRKKRPFNLITHRAAKKCQLLAGAAWNPKSWRHQSCWRDVLTGEEREWEILRTSSAPGISRHHWGTEFDLFGLSPRRFMDGEQLADEYAWMRDQAVHFGFFQPYTATSRDAKGMGYIEERWHWSYYPIAQALFDFALEHRDVVGGALEARWDAYETDWQRRYRTNDPFFGFIRRHWGAFMFNIDTSL